MTGSDPTVWGALHSSCIAVADTASPRRSRGCSGTKKQSNQCIAVSELHHTATGNHVMWDHTVLPATRQQWLSSLTPAEAGTRFSDHGGMEGWIDLGGGYNSQDNLPAKDSHLPRKQITRQCCDREVNPWPQVVSPTSQALNHRATTTVQQTANSNIHLYADTMNRWILDTNFFRLFYLEKWLLNSWVLNYTNGLCERAHYLFGLSLNHNTTQSVNQLAYQLSSSVYPVTITEPKVPFSLLATLIRNRMSECVGFNVPLDT